jgi:GH25 family lysozyme M1 (1,4-beta-N-acetylmuramidase)
LLDFTYQVKLSYAYCAESLMKSKLLKSVFAIPLVLFALFNQILSFSAQAAGPIYQGFSVLPSSQAVGSAIKLQAWGEGDELNYKFYVYKQSDGEIKIMKPFSPENIACWIPGEAGDYLVYVVMRDKSGAIVEKCIDCKIHPIEAPSIPKMNVMVSKDSCKVAESVLVVANFFGKNPDSEIRLYVYNPSTGEQEELGNFATGYASWGPKKAGDYLVFASGRDSDGKVLEGFVPIKVIEPPQITYLGFGASCSSPQRAGTAITFNAAATCADGSPPLYRFYVLDPASGNTEEIKPYNEESTGTWSPSSGGNYIVYVTIKDAAGHVIEKAIDFTVTSLERIRGIDVASCQGVMDFDTAKAQGIQFAMIRSSFGDDEPGQHDRRFLENVRKAKDAGLHIGIYHYFYGTNVEKAVGEAHHCLNMIREAERLYGRPLFTYPIALDVEDAALARLPREELTNYIIAWARVIREAGYLPAVYINPLWIRNNINLQPIKDAGILLWLAQWGVDAPDYDCAIWQCSGGGLGNGAQYGASSNDIDLDIAFTDLPRMVREGHYNGF